MKGSDLKCECGAGAVDVAPDLEIGERVSISWHCASGCLNISGSRPGRAGFQQQRFRTGEVVTIATYADDGKCVDCGGGRASHDFDCPAVVRAAACGVALGRRFRGDACIELRPPMPSTGSKQG